MAASKFLDDYDTLCVTARKSKAGIQAAALRPILPNTTYSQVACSHGIAADGYCMSCVKIDPFAATCTCAPTVTNAACPIHGDGYSEAT